MSCRITAIGGEPEGKSSLLSPLVFDKFFCGTSSCTALGEGRQVMGEASQVTPKARNLKNFICALETSSPRGNSVQPQSGVLSSRALMESRDQNRNSRMKPRSCVRRGRKSHSLVSCRSSKEETARELG